MKFIVDVNVPIVANDIALIAQGKEQKSPQADDACRLAALETLKRLMREEIIVLDEGGELLKKYRSYLNGSGFPGIGDAFFRYLSDHHYNDTKIERTNLRMSLNGEYTDFPMNDALQHFDRDDRVFVALALATPGKPEIINAVDSDYRNHKEDLQRFGVSVLELCLSCLKLS
jgi:hypothetical protein